MSDKKGRSRRTMLLIALAGLGLVAAAFCAGLYIIVPAVVRSRLRAGFGEYWRGEVRIGRVDVNLFGPSRIAGIRLFDEVGRQCVAIDGITLGLRNWPGQEPVLEMLGVQAVGIDLYRQDNELVLPVRMAKGPGNLLDKYVDLRSCVLGRVDLALHDSGRAVRRWAWRDLALTRHGEGFCFEADGQLLAKNIRLSNHPIGPEPVGTEPVGTEPAGTAPVGTEPVGTAPVGTEPAETEPVGTSPVGTEPVGTAPVGTKPVGTEPVGPAPVGLEPVGTEPVGTEPAGTAPAGTGPAESEAGKKYEFHASVCGGQVDATLIIGPGRDGRYRGSLKIRNLDLARLPRAASPRPAAQAGLLSGKLTIQGDGLSLDAVSGQGSFDIRHVNARQGPLTGQLLSFLNGQEQGAAEAPSLSDIDAAFDLRRSLAIVRHAKLTDPLRVMTVEPGGTVDLRTGGLDLYLVTVRVRGLSSLIDSLPVVNVAAIIADKLMRVHVTGTWDNQKISKEPVKDVSAVTMAILNQAVTSGTVVPARAGHLMAELWGEMRRSLAPTATASTTAATTSTAPATRP